MVVCDKNKVETVEVEVKVKGVDDVVVATREVNK